jgi:hypothetical protein
MENHVINDVIIRDYLLGRLEPQSDLTQRIDEESLTNPEMSLTVDVIEDEIIEDYIEGTLKAEDTLAVERHFLRPPERQRKLRTARLFSHQFPGLSSDVRYVEKPEPARRFFKVFPHKDLLPSFRTCAELAACVLFTVSILNLWNRHRGLDMAVKQINQQLAQERQHSAALSQQLQPALVSSQPAIVMLNLVRSGLQRGELDLPEVKLFSGTKTLHVEVALSSTPSERYHVQLRQAGKITWSRDAVDAIGVQGGAILKLEIPAEILSEGACELVVLPHEGGTISYWFSISKFK